MISRTRSEKASHLSEMSLKFILSAVEGLILRSIYMTKPIFIMSQTSPYRIRVLDTSAKKPQLELTDET